MDKGPSGQAVELAIAFSFQSGLGGPATELKALSTSTLDYVCPVRGSRGTTSGYTQHGPVPEKRQVQEAEIIMDQLHGDTWRMDKGKGREGRREEKIRVATLL